MAASLFRDALNARKIQPDTFRWPHVRSELRYGMINLTLVAAEVTGLLAWWKQIGWIKFVEGPAPWTTIAGEYALSFFLFDAKFYWVDRAMHKEPYCC